MYILSNCTLSSRNLQNSLQYDQRADQKPIYYQSIEPFSVVGPVVWNGLPQEIRLLPGTLTEAFVTKLKTVLFGRAGVGSASE